ncbi:MAG: NADH-ubiquinone oxidoreductase-F iron-sulfur binding region domain-containing protein [Anaerolineales bacterium]|nr:NADH-ubiquinone oxidoreductase-F iron-sulfur binding region domain-containing protein [Anaerolineales bacterium]
MDAETLEPLAAEMEVSVARLLSAASFYHYFSLPASDELRCEGPVCQLNGHTDQSGHPDRGIACPGLCDQAPASFKNGGYRANGREPIYLLPVQNQSDSGLAIFDGWESDGPEGIDDYRRVGGYAALEALLNGTDAESALEVLEASGLEGRGGAAFPLATKWRAVRGEKSESKYVVCNADEGEPGTFKDRAILHLRPHLVLEAMAIAGRLVGADTGIIYLRYEYPQAMDILDRAVHEAEAQGLLGDRVMGADFSFSVNVRRGAGSYVCGEETALLNSLEGKRPWPRERPPYPTSQGLWGQPTLVNNVETLAQVPAILRNGATWFRGLGRGSNAGTKLYSLSGSVKRPGNYELPLGTTARELIYTYGGGPSTGQEIKGFTLGGISGGLLGAADLDLELDYRSPQKLGVHLGSGGVIVLDDSDCVVDFVGTCLAFYQHESCGKCFPCRIGTVRLREFNQGAASLNGIKEGMLTQVGEIASVMRATSACGLGKSAPLVLQNMMERFEADFQAHLEGRCPSGICAR